MDTLFQKVSELNRAPFQLGIFREGDKIVNWNIELTNPASKIFAKLLLLYIGYVSWTRRRCLQSVTRKRVSRCTEPVGYSSLLVGLAFPFAMELGLQDRGKGRIMYSALTVILVLGMAYMFALLIADKNIDSNVWNTSNAWKKCFIVLHLLFATVIVANEIFVRFPDYFSSSEFYNLSFQSSCILFFVVIEILLNCVGALSHIVAKSSFLMFGRIHTTRLLFKHMGLSLNDLRTHGVTLEDLGTVLKGARKHGRRANSVSVSRLRKAGYEGDARRYIQAGFSSSSFKTDELQKAGFTSDEIRRLSKIKNMFMKLNDDDRKKEK